MNEFLGFIWENRTTVGEQVLEHLWLTLVALGFAILVGVLMGIGLSRKPKIAPPVLAVVNVLQTIPSIALLGFLLPFMGIGAKPAIFALFLYALLPIVRNTWSGLQGVDPAVKEAGLGMGLSGWQMLVRLELPLAAPVIFAGLRIATVVNIGIATLCALIGAGGLGEYIFRGIALNNSNMILAGAVPAALLALFFDGLLALLQKYVQKVLKPLLIVAGILLLGIPVLLLLNRGGETEMRAGFPSEFMERDDGWPLLKQEYGLEMDVMEMEQALMYDAVKEAKVDVIAGYTSDGRIDAFDLKVLEDDKFFFPPYYAAPLINGNTHRNYPEVAEVLEQLAGMLNDPTMRRLNYRAEAEGATPHQIAEDFLEEKGFQTRIQRDGPGDIVIGSKIFTEQFILAEMFAILLENQTTLDVELRTGLGGTKLCFDALRSGEIDIYPEYTGTGFLAHLEPDSTTRTDLIRDPEAVYGYVKREFHVQYDLHWCSPLGFNNAYAMVMRRSHADSLGISTISDLARFTK